MNVSDSSFIVRVIRAGEGGGGGGASSGLGGSLQMEAPRICTLHARELPAGAADVQANRGVEGPQWCHTVGARGWCGIDPY